MSNIPTITKDETNNLSKGRFKKPKGWGHWNDFIKSKEYQQMVAGNREISVEELAIHCKPGDLWIGLSHNKRICVFDVTLFAEYHPGGYDILANVAGKDATEEFRMAHAYVNANMIAKFQLGYLVRTAFISPNSLTPGMTMMPPVRRPPPRSKPKWDWSELSSGFTSLKFELIEPLRQGINNICIGVSKDNLFSLRMFCDDKYYLFEIKLHKYLSPDMDSLSYSTEGQGVVVIKIKSTQKSSTKLSSLGGIVTDRIITLTEALDKDEYMSCTLSSFRDLNGDCREFVFDLPVNHRVGIPLGHHVVLRANIKGEIIQRPYTPVCEITPNPKSKATNKSIRLMIKRYDDGIMSSYVHSLDRDSQLELSLPLGSYRTPRWYEIEPVITKMITTSSTASHNLVLLAAGSGITPMITIMVNALAQNKSRVNLLFFNRKITDIIYREEFDALVNYYKPQCTVEHILSQPEDSWTGNKGRVSLDIVENNLKKNNLVLPSDKIVFMFCGPSGFNKTCVELMKQLKISQSHFWEFKG